jgi:hypothetical protein
MEHGRLTATEMRFLRSMLRGREGRINKGIKII